MFCSSKVKCHLCSTSGTGHFFFFFAKTRGQARPKWQPKQPDKHGPAKQGRQQGFTTGAAVDDTARDAATKLKATSKQASKVKAAWKAAKPPRPPLGATPWQQFQPLLSHA